MKLRGVAMAALAGAFLSGCAAMKESAGHVQKRPAFDFAGAQSNPSPLADQYVGTESKKSVANNKVFIRSFRANFAKMSKSSASGAGLSGGAKVKVHVKLKGIEAVDFQALTDQMYQQFVADLQAQGFEVVAPDMVAQKAAYQELAAESHPDAGLDSEDTFIATPRGVKLLKQVGDQGVGAFAGTKIGMRVDKAINALATELGAAPVEVSVNVPFVRFAGTKGIFTLGSSAQVSWLPELSLGGQVTVRNNPHSSGTYLQGMARAYTKDNLVSGEDIGELQAAKVGMFKGEPPSLSAKPEGYKAGVTKTFTAASKLLTLKLKQAQSQ